MNNRSRRTSLGARYALLAVVGLTMTLGPVGCASTLPRQHWWQFWRPKAAPISSVFSSPDRILPPPPDVPLGAGTSGGIPPPPNPITGSTATAEAEALRQQPRDLAQLQVVHFEYDSADLSADAVRALDQNAQWLIAHPGLQIQIEGHCDERGSVEYNLNLGDRRAKAVRAYLMQKGVSGDTLHTMSYGKERPIDPSGSEEAFRQNRRASFLAYQ